MNITIQHNLTLSSYSHSHPPHSPYRLNMVNSTNQLKFYHFIESQSGLMNQLVCNPQVIGHLHILLCWLCIPAYLNWNETMIVRWKCWLSVISECLHPYSVNNWVKILAHVMRENAGLCIYYAKLYPCVPILLNNQKKVMIPTVDVDNMDVTTTNSWHPAIGPRSKNYLLGP